MWFGAGFVDIGAELRAMHHVLRRIDRTTRQSLEEDMATNDELATIKAQLTEASTEIPAKLDELLAQVGDQADPALVAEIKTLSAGLADIVPNVPVDGGEDAPQ